MIVMFRMPASKKEKLLKKLDKMEEFIYDFKTCLEEAAEEEESEYRKSYRHDEDDEEEEYMPKSRYSYARMNRRGRM